MSIFRAKWLLPATASPIEDGAIVVEGGRIAKLGPARDFGGEPIRDLGDVILLPGLINTHTHLEFTHHRGRLAAGTLWEWFDRLRGLEQTPNAKNTRRAAIVEGARQSLTAGVTCVGDISAGGLHVQALRSSPIRKVCFLELTSGGLEPPNNIDTLTNVLDAALSSAEPLKLMLGLTPHALYTVTHDDLEGISRLALNQCLPITLHLLETPEEAEWLAGRDGFLDRFLMGHRLPTAAERTAEGAIGRLRQAALLDQRPLLVHVNYVSDEQLAELAAVQANIAYCPRSHRFFNHEPHRWREMLAAGISVCLGTDSLASNESLSILDEMRFLRREAPEVPAHRLIEMGTIHGAVGLGLDSQLGSLERGKCADFITIPWEPVGPADPAADLLDGKRVVNGVWVDGVQLMQPDGITASPCSETRDGDMFCG